jgi:hypothetical protein
MWCVADLNDDYIDRMEDVLEMSAIIINRRFLDFAEGEQHHSRRRRNHPSDHQHSQVTV